MENKVSYAIVGLFVLLLGLAGVAVALWLSVGSNNQVYHPYLAYMAESVSGLTVNAPVKYRGVEVGRVEGIALVPDNPELVELRLSLEQGTPVKQDTVAVLKTQGLTGLAFVELTGGSRGSAPLVAGPHGRPPEIPTAPSLLERLDTAITTVLGKVEGLSVSLADVLSPANRTALHDTLAHLETITGGIAHQRHALDQAIADGAATMANAHRASNQLPALLESLQRGTEAVEQTSRGLAKTADGAAAAVQEGRRSLSRFGQETLPEVTALVSELRDLTGTLHRFTEGLERDPNMLLFGRRDRRSGPGE